MIIPKNCSKHSYDMHTRPVVIFRQEFTYESYTLSDGLSIFVEVGASLCACASTVSHHNVARSSIQFHQIILRVSVVFEI